MKDIFTNLYNKVVSFFNKTDEAQKENAKDVACNRLKLVLMQDRTNLTPAIMDRMRRELVDLLSKYLELDRELLDLNFEHEDEQMALMLSIPVIRAKSEDEIQAILDKEDEEKKRLEELSKSDDEEDSDESDEDEKEESDEENESDEESVDEPKEDEADTESEESEEKETEEESDSAETEDESDEDEDEDIDEDTKKEKFFSKKKGKTVKG